MITAILSTLLLSTPAEAKLVKSIIHRPNEKVTRETLPAAKVCDGRERNCLNGRRAALVLPNCELVCPEDGHENLVCYSGLAGEANESTWVEIPEEPGAPEIYAEAVYTPSAEGSSPDCEVYELVKTPTLPASAFRRPAGHAPSRVRTAR